MTIQEKKQVIKIKDIYKGKLVDVWEDGDFVTIAIYPITLAIPKEDWKELKEELKKIK